MNPERQQFSFWPAIPPKPEVPLHEADASACVYLPGQSARIRAFYAQTLAPDEYQSLMDAGFRRSGRAVYQPVCGACRACIPLRVPTVDFRPNKSQRRCQRQNSDVTVEVGAPIPTREKLDLYQRYQQDWHGKLPEPDGGAPAFVEFLYDSPVDTLEFVYRDTAGRLLAAGICDVGPHFLSSVYFYFDPAEAKRGLGTFGAVYEINWARDRGLAYWYAGYWVRACPKMAYKADYGPHELLGGDGVWRRPTPSA